MFKLSRLFKSTLFFTLSLTLTSALAKGAEVPLAKAEASTLEKDTSKSFSFVQTADLALIEPVDTAKNLYKLTLKKVPPFVSYFSDRPNRNTGLMPLSQFLKAWQKGGADSFAVDPPNVSISGSKVHWIIEKTNEFYVTVLTNPHYNSKTHSVTYDLKLLSAMPADGLQKPITLHNAVLFFDGWCPSCCCG